LTVKNRFDDKKALNIAHQDYLNGGTSRHVFFSDRFFGKKCRITHLTA